VVGEQQQQLYSGIGRSYRFLVAFGNSRNPIPTTLAVPVQNDGELAPEDENQPPQDEHICDERHHAQLCQIMDEQEQEEDDQLH